jgi:hypothetical protein
MASEDTSDYVLNPAQIKALKKAVFSKKYGVNSEDEITLTLCDLHRGKCVYEEVIMKACVAYLRNYPCKSAKQELAMHQGMEYFEEVLLDYENEEQYEDEEQYEEEDPYTYDYSPPFPWTYKGTNYMTDKNNHVWRVHADGGCGQWYGVYNPDKDCIEDTMYNAIYAAGK